MKFIGPEPTIEEYGWRHVQNFAGINVIIDMWGQTVSIERIQEFNNAHAQWLKESKIKASQSDRFLIHDSTGDCCFVDRFGTELQEPKKKIRTKDRIKLDASRV